MQNPNFRPDFPGVVLDDDEPDLLELVTVIAEHIKLLVLGPLVVGLVALGYTYTQTPVFTARTTIIPPTSQPAGAAAAILGQLGGMGGLGSLVAGGAGAPGGKHMAYLNSDLLRDQVIRQFDLQKRWGHAHISQTRYILSKSIEILEDKKIGLIEVAFTDANAKFAAELVNAYVAALSQVLGEAAIVEARERREFLEKQLAEAMKKSYQSPQVRDAVIQGLIQQAEASRLAERQQNPNITQVDKAEAPIIRSGPKRTQTAVIATLATLALLVVLVFIRYVILSALAKPESAEKLKRIRRVFGR
jgi:uncharacterized protein involved in exopolysaccharide biosynthesis